MAIPSESQSRPQQLSRAEPIHAILVAEDPFISTFLRAVLQRHGHKVILSDPYRATDSMRSGELKTAVVITNNPEVFLPFADTLPMLYIAANPDPELAQRFHACRILRKPFRNEDLLEAVQELIPLVIP
jgi:hypothetical protein